MSANINILCKNVTAYNALSALLPALGVCTGIHKAYINGGYVVHHWFSDNDITVLQTGLATQITAGDILFADTVPADWVSASDTP